MDCLAVVKNYEVINGSQIVNVLFSLGKYNFNSESITIWSGSNAYPKFDIFTTQLGTNADVLSSFISGILLLIAGKSVCI